MSEFRNLSHKSFELEKQRISKDECRASKMFLIVVYMHQALPCFWDLGGEGRAASMFCTQPRDLG